MKIKTLFLIMTALFLSLCSCIGTGKVETPPENTEIVNVPEETAVAEEEKVREFFVSEEYQAGGMLITVSAEDSAVLDEIVKRAEDKNGYIDSVSNSAKVCGIMFDGAFYGYSNMGVMDDVEAVRSLTLCEGDAEKMNTILAKYVNVEYDEEFQSEVNMPTSIYCNISGYTMDEVDPLMEYPYVRLIRNASELSENGIYADYPADFFDKYGIIMVAFPDKSGNTAYGIRQICKRSGGKVAVYAERSQAQDLGEKTWYFLIEYALEDAEPQSELDISVYFNDIITAKPSDPSHAKK